MNRQVCLEELAPRVVPSGLPYIPATALSVVMVQQPPVVISPDSLLLTQEESITRATYNEANEDWDGLVYNNGDPTQQAVDPATFRTRIEAMVTAWEANVEQLDLTVQVARQRLDAAEQQGARLGIIAVRTITLTGAVADYTGAVAHLNSLQGLLQQPDDQIVQSGAALANIWSTWLIIKQADARDANDQSDRLRQQNADFTTRYPVDVTARRVTVDYGRLADDYSDLKAALRP